LVSEVKLIWHRAQGTGLRAKSTGHRAKSTGLRAQGMELGQMA